MQNTSCSVHPPTQFIPWHDESLQVTRTEFKEAAFNGENFNMDPGKEGKQRKMGKLMEISWWDITPSQSVRAETLNYALYGESNSFPAKCTPNFPRLSLSDGKADRVSLSLPHRSINRSYVTLHAGVPLRWYSSVPKLFAESTRGTEVELAQDPSRINRADIGRGMLERTAHS